ncbi:unnamed protein product [Calypogeia fissa]
MTSDRQAVHNFHLAERCVNRRGFLRLRVMGAHTVTVPAHSGEDRGCSTSCTFYPMGGDPVPMMLVAPLPPHGRHKPNTRHVGFVIIVTTPTIITVEPAEPYPGATHDTGSDLTWVQCKALFELPRRGGLHVRSHDVFYLQKKFIMLKSSLRRTSPSRIWIIIMCTEGCLYDLHYGDGSYTSGYFSTESLTVETTDRGSIVLGGYAFGCGYAKHGLSQGIDGLVGLGKGLLSFPSQISHFVDQKFSYCLVNFWKASTEGSQLLFGSLAAANSFSMNFTTLVHNQMRSSNYYVDLEDIAVDGVPLGNSPTAFQIKSDGLGGTFLDTGTTVTHLVRPAYEALLRTLKSTIHYPIEDGLHLRLELCFNMSGISSPTFPSIRLQFKGADLDLPSDNTFISVGHKRAKCLAILPSEHFNVIGSIQMQDFKFLIDVEFSRIGFKREECGEASSEF